MVDQTFLVHFNVEFIYPICKLPKFSDVCFNLIKFIQDSHISYLFIYFGSN